MLDPVHWPSWVHIGRLLGTLGITVVFGIHAYDRHVREAVQAVSPRKLMYWLYAIVFLAATVANFTQFLITLMFQSYERASFHLGYSTLLLVLSYVVLLAGVSRKTHQ